ncbi:hypothetical protein GH714_002892 [Hevea brasiliensis]|uniref:Uncharacterized protein n=1 Tax=Hevea brasiliensis TaxID=3981 RepID=A0A6A6KX33_HEVBR|nr:hypothetical protein GH714_002892 [Hevea brasiliensis]
MARTMPPKVISDRGHGANRGCSVRRVLLANVGRPHRDPTVAPPPPEEAVDLELTEDLGAFVAQVVTAAIIAKPKDPWEVVDRAIHLGAYDFEGSFDADVANKWLKRVVKVFDLMKLTNADRMDNMHGLLQDILPSKEAKYDRFRQGLHVGIRSSMTWFRGSNFHELVEAALNIEKVRQEEKEYEQKMSRKHGQSSS